jgi:hypothetical protein
MPVVLDANDGSVIKRVECRDFYEASYLVAIDYKLDHAYARGSDQMLVFLDVKAADLIAYVNGTALVNARKLFDSSKALRTLLQTTRDSQGLRTGAPVIPPAAAA